MTVIDKMRLSEKVCDLPDEFMRQCDENIQLLLDL